MQVENDDRGQELLSNTIWIILNVIPVSEKDIKTTWIRKASRSHRPLLIYGLMVTVSFRDPLFSLGGPSDRTGPCLQGGRKQLRGSFLHVFISSAQLLISVV